MEEPNPILKQEATRLSQEQSQGRHPDALRKTEVIPSIEHHDKVRVVFDWEIPLGIPTLLTFIAEAHRHGERSRIQFQIDLSRLPTAQLGQIRTILTARVAGTDDAVAIVRSVTWLLEVSIAQAESQLCPAQRQQKVRELLLAPEQVGIDHETGSGTR